MTRSAKSKAEAAQEEEQARKDLRKLLPPGSSVWCRVEHVSASGMSRILTFQIPMRVRGRLVIQDITWRVALATGHKLSDKPCWGLRVGGCGMDMRFHVLQNLSYALHGWPGSGSSPAQDRARTGRLAAGIKDDGPEDFSPRRPGYTLRVG